MDEGREGEGKLTVEPTSHSRVEREVDVLDGDFAILEVVGSRDLGALLVKGLARDDVALGPLGEDNLQVFLGNTGGCGRFRRLEFNFAETTRLQKGVS